MLSLVPGEFLDGPIFNMVYHHAKYPKGFQMDVDQLN